MQQRDDAELARSETARGRHDDDRARRLDPSVTRRGLLGAAVALPAAAWLAGCGDDGADGEATVGPYAGEPVTTAPPPGGSLESWEEVRALFDLDPEVRHLSAYVLAPHSKPVREAIERHRRGLDRDPQGHFGGSQWENESRSAELAADFLGTSTDRVALTDSTTMGLGVLIGGMRFEPGDEILMTAHEHFVADEAARHASERTGATVRRVELYPSAAPEQATSDGIVTAIERAITPRTRLVLITWVHSATGVRVPVRAIADVVADANDGREADERALLLVDGVHGFGSGPMAVGDLGCDGFVAGCHKWLLGPRGTGIAWAREELWERATPIIPSFDERLYGPWTEGRRGTAPPGGAFTPGGYHSFEHRWALRDAFELHARIGSDRIAARIEALGSRLRDGLAEIPDVRVHAPAEQRLRSGVVTFSVRDRDPRQVVDRIFQTHRVQATVTPYAVPLARLGTCWLNTEEEVDAALDAVRAV